MSLLIDIRAAEASPSDPSAAAEHVLTADKSVVDSPSCRILGHGAPQRSRLNSPVTPRRSRRLQSKHCPSAAPQSLPQQPPSERDTSYIFLPNAGHREFVAPLKTETQGVTQPQASHIQVLQPNNLVEEPLERPSKLARLTKKNLRVLEGMARKNHPATKSSTEQSSSTASTKTKTSTLSTTDPGFREAALENGILGIIDSIKNENLTLMQTRLREGRKSPSPPEAEFEWYSKTVEMVDFEDTLIERTKFKLLKEYDDKEIFYSRVTNQAFNAFPKNVGLNNGLSSAKPDMAEGFRLPEWRPYQVRKELGGSAVPFKGLYAIVLPQIAGEWKAPGKDMFLAKIQAAYDGAHMVYGRNKALESIGKPDDPGHAFITTFITDGTIFEAYAHHSTESKGKVEYHMCRITSLHMTSSHDSYVTSRRALRNLQDFAKEQSEKLRDLLKLTWEEREQGNEGKPLKRNYDAHKRGEGGGEGDGNDVDSLAKILTPDDSSSSSSSSSSSKRSKQEP